MKTYDLKDKRGRAFAFEVNNFFLGRQGLLKVVLTIPNARIIRKPKRFQLFAEDKFFEFEVEGKRFEAFEPWGDSSRFWIGPIPPKWCKQVEKVKKAFTRFNLIMALFSF